MILSIDTMGAKYVDPVTDFGFKLFFGTDMNKDLLISFLSALLNKRRKKSEWIKIDDVEYLSQEQLGQRPADRRAIFDIYCKTKDGRRFIVEMQNAYQDFFRERSIYYSSFPIQAQAKKGNWNFRMDEIYTIGILDFEFSDNDDGVARDEVVEDGFYHEVKLKDVETNEVFYDKLTYIYVELPKFKREITRESPLLDKWLFVLRNMGKLMSRPAELQERVFAKIFKAAAIARLDEKERWAYDESMRTYRDNYAIADTRRREKLKLQRMEKRLVQAEEQLEQALEKGRAQGKAEGKAEAMEEMLRKLRAAGFTAEQIAAVADKQ